MENSESKAAIFAVGGMNIGKAITMLRESNGILTTDIANIETGGVGRKVFVRAAKRISAFILAAVAFLILSPFLVIISAFFVLSMIGPVLFNLERVGLKRGRFFILKFRRSNKKTEKTSKVFGNHYESKDPTIKIMNVQEILNEDSSKNKKGADEMQQFFNVYMGDRSIMGANTTLSGVAEKYEYWQIEKLLVEPALLNTWQILPDANEVYLNNWMKIKTKYKDSRSLTSDTHLFLRTFRTMFFK